MSLSHRRGNIQDSTGAARASWTVTAYPVGAVVSGAGSSTPITVNAPHSLAAGDKFIVGTDTTTFRAVSGTPTATSIAYAGAALTVSVGDTITNLGPDTGTTSPNWDGSPMGSYTDPDGGTANTQARVTTNSDGEYDYYHKGDGLFWEVVRDSDGTIQQVIKGFGGIPGRFNIADFGALIDGSTDDAARIQSAMDAITSLDGGICWLPPGITGIGTGLAAASVDVGVVGTGKSVIKALAAVDMLTFTKGAGTGTGAIAGPVRDFVLDGDGIATKGVQFPFTANMRIEGIQAKGIAGWGFVFDALQNSTITKLSADNCTHAFGVFNNCGHLSFNQLSCSRIGGYYLVLDDDDNPDGLTIGYGFSGRLPDSASSPLTENTRSWFHNLILEAPRTGHDATCLVYLGQALDNYFNGCYILSGASQTALTELLRIGASADKNHFFQTSINKAAGETFNTVVNDGFGTMFIDCNLSTVSAPALTSSDKCTVFLPGDGNSNTYVDNGTGTQTVQWIDTYGQTGVTHRQNVLMESHDTGAAWKRISISEDITLSTVGVTTDSTASLLPIGLIEAVTCKVIEAISGGGATSFSIGDDQDPDLTRFASGVALALNTASFGIAHWNNTPVDVFQGAASKVRITVAGGTPTQGKLRVTVFCKTFSAPDSV